MRVHRIRWNRQFSAVTERETRADIASISEAAPATPATTATQPAQAARRRVSGLREVIGTSNPQTGGPWTYGNGQRNTVYIVDVDGTRQVIDTMYLPGTTAANLAEREQILASIPFEP
jgi:hypothetical protein